jgi:hypothetical protein
MTNRLTVDRSTTELLRKTEGCKCSSNAYFIVHKPVSVWQQFSKKNLKSPIAIATTHFQPNNHSIELSRICESCA